MNRTTYFLLLDIVVLLFQTTTILCSVLFLVVFRRVTKKKKYSCSRLLVFLAVADLLSAVTTIPYSIYLVTNWNPTFIDLNPYYVAILSAPAPFFSKVHLGLTISAAFERTLVRNKHI
ncbi:hypothetical protein COOONC_15298 [Cooperia oncophora]